MMESGSEGENQEFEVEKQGKPKWQMKTPFQLDTLERAYAEDMYPSEAAMLELSEKLNLTDRQLQMWFCHRRLKDKKGGTPSTPAKKAKKVGAPTALASPEEKIDVGDQYSEQGSGSKLDQDTHYDSPLERDIHQHSGSRSKKAWSNHPLSSGPKHENSEENRAFGAKSAQVEVPADRLNKQARTQPVGSPAHAQVMQPRLARVFMAHCSDGSRTRSSPTSPGRVSSAACSDGACTRPSLPSPGRVSSAAPLRIASHPAESHLTRPGPQCTHLGQNAHPPASMLTRSGLLLSLLGSTFALVRVLQQPPGSRLKCTISAPSEPTGWEILKDPTDRLGN